MSKYSDIYLIALNKLAGDMTMDYMHKQIAEGKQHAKALTSQLPAGQTQGTFSQGKLLPTGQMQPSPNAMAGQAQAANNGVAPVAPKVVAPAPTQPTVMGGLKPQTFVSPDINQY